MSLGAIGHRGQTVMWHGSCLDPPTHGDVADASHLHAEMEHPMQISLQKRALFWRLYEELVAKSEMPIMLISCDRVHSQSEGYLHNP